MKYIFSSALVLMVCAFTLRAHACDMHAHNATHAKNHVVVASNDPSQNPGQDPGQNPVQNPSQDPGQDPGQNPTQDPGQDPGQDPHQG